MFQKCKVTVVKKAFSDDLVEEYTKQPERFSVCEMVEEGQEFFITNAFEMPEGICPYAWADIRHMILSIATGGSFEMMKDSSSALANCTDLFRPVTFKIERVD
ncbi:MAG: TIGR04076 family protein [Desulfobulbaceae bacterium]|nr:MAG: TIGR04076 family protein [Desulfobulbaceae bacterium]